MEFYQDLMQRTETFLNELEVPILERMEEERNAASVRGYAVYINIGGSLRGAFLLSAEKELAYHLAYRSSYKKPAEQEVGIRALETLAETANVISGNALNGRDDIILGVPMVIVSGNAVVKPSDGMIKHCKFTTRLGSLYSMYIPAKTAGVFRLEAN